MLGATRPVVHAPPTLQGASQTTAVDDGSVFFSSGADVQQKPRAIGADLQRAVVFRCWNARGDPVRLHEGAHHLRAPVRLFFMSFTGFVKFLLFWLATSLSLLVDVYLGHLLAFVLPNIVMASLGASVVSTVFFLFVGFNPQGSSISAGCQWLYAITPQRYVLLILATLTYGDCPTNPELDAVTGAYINVGPEIGCQPLQDAPLAVGNVTVKGLLEEAYNTKHDDIGRYFGALVVVVVVFRVLALLALQFLNHQKR